MTNHFIEQVEAFLADYSYQNQTASNTEIDEKYVHKKNTSNVLITPAKEINMFAESSQNQDVRFYTCFGKPNLECGFIFDHPQDHYPLMLLIEMGRQMAISISHLYKDIPFELCRNTVDNMKFKVFDFVELDLPLVIGCVDKMTKNKPNIQIRELELFFYQGGRKCCVSQSSISIMSTNLYNRYRLASRRSNVNNDIDLSLITNECLSNKEFGNAH